MISIKCINDIKILLNSIYSYICPHFSEVYEHLYIKLKLIDLLIIFKFSVLETGVIIIIFFDNIFTLTGS